MLLRIFRFPFIPQPIAAETWIAGLCHARALGGPLGRLAHSPRFGRYRQDCRVAKSFLKFPRSFDYFPQSASWGDAQSARPVATTWPKCFSGWPPSRCVGIGIGVALKIATIIPAPSQVLRKVRRVVSCGFSHYACRRRCLWCALSTHWRWRSLASNALIGLASCPCVSVAWVSRSTLELARGASWFSHNLARGQHRWCIGFRLPETLSGSGKIRTALPRACCFRGNMLLQFQN